MNTVQYIRREFVPTVDLQTLGNAYNTLEQGHQAAVNAASELKNTIASLDMNEDEDDWKQQKYAQIQNTIDNNTLYGNSWAALDNLVTELGNIQSDQGTIGRLRAQKEYKAFQAKVDSMNMDEEYKQIFKDINPYYYSDKIDPESGKVVGSSTWKPTHTPVNTVPLSDIILNGIKIAAEDSNESSATFFLDRNGKPTTDENKSFDGQVYQSTTSGYKMLSKDKILQGIKTFIETTPGAKASLHQDYYIAKYKYKRDGYNSDLTDENGVPLNEEQYLMKRIDPALQAASYYNVKNTTKYGDGLSTYKAAMNASGSGKGIADTIANMHIISKNTPITMDYDYAGNLRGQQQSSYNNLVSAYQQFSGKNLAGSMNNATTEDWKKLIDEVDNPQIASVMRRNLRKLEEANYNYSQISKQLPNDTKREDLDFVTRMNNGGKFDSNNPNDEKVLNIINNNLLGADGQTLMITTDNDNMYNDLLSIINGNDVTGYKTLGVQTGQNPNGTKYFKIDRNNYENFVLLSNAYNTALSRQSLWGRISTDTHINILDADGNTIQNKGRYSSETYFKDLGRIYDNVNKSVKQDLQNIAPTTITISNENLPGKTFLHETIYNLYTSGEINDTQFNTNNKRFTDELNNKLLNTNFTQVDIFGVQDTGKKGTLYRLPETENRAEIGTKIINAIGTERLGISAAHNPVYGHGTNITIYSKADKDGNPTGEPERYFIPGLITEEAALAFDNDPSTIASDNIALGNETKKTISLTTSYNNPTLGNQQIICKGNNQFVYKTDYGETPVSRDGAAKINEMTERYQQVKDEYMSGGFDVTDSNQMNALSNIIKKYATEIATASGQEDNVNAIYNSMLHDITQ